MRSPRLSQLLMLVPVLALAVSAPAQDKFEAGGLAVASFYQDLNVRSGPVTGAMGFQPGASGGLLVGQTLTDRLGGEVRYVFSHNDLRLKSGSAETLFSAHTHIVHYDLLFYAARRSAAVRPYLAGVRRDFFNLTARRFMRTVWPGTSEDESFALALPAGTKGPLDVRARLRFRKSNQRFTDWVFDPRPLREGSGYVGPHKMGVELPITDLATAAMTLPGPPK